MKKIYFRADASFDIGYGHFVRSLALANMLKDDFDCYFATIHPTEYQLNEIEKVCKYLPIPNDDSHYDYFLSLLTGDEIVVLDNYFFTTEYQRKIKNKGCKLVCIDDMHDKHYVADVVINHGLSDASLFDIEPYTRLCLGLEWSLLRKPFLEAQPSEKREKGHVVVGFGGVDYYNLTTKVVSILSKHPNVNKITAIVGDANKSIEIISAIPKVEIRKNLSAQEIADLFCRVEFAVLPASTILLEALACNCPVASGYYVDNQFEYYIELKRKNYIYPLGDLLQEGSIEQLHTYEPTLRKSKIILNGSKWKYIFYGLTFRIINYTNLSYSESKEVWATRVLPEVRQWMNNSEVFSFESHNAFIDKLKNDNTKQYWAVFLSDSFVGSYYLTDIYHGHAERGIFLSPLYWGKSFSWIIEKWFDLLVGLLGVEKILAEVKENNLRSLFFHKKLGYKNIKKERKKVYLERLIKNAGHNIYY